MAMGYARISGRPGICFAPSGPGVANLVPGILEAHSACLPVIAIGCSSKRANAGMGAFQEWIKIAILKPITKWSERVTSRTGYPGSCGGPFPWQPTEGRGRFTWISRGIRVPKRRQRPGMCPWNIPEGRGGPAKDQGGSGSFAESQKAGPGGGGRGGQLPGLR